MFSQIEKQEPTVEIKNQFINDLLCVCCWGHLLEVQKEDGVNLICNNCKECYPSVDGIPVLINENNSIFRKGEFVERGKTFFYKSKLNYWFSKLIPPLGINWVAPKNYRYLKLQLTSKVTGNSKPRILVVGGSIEGRGFKNLVDNNLFEIIEGDISFGPKTKIIFDAHDMPFADNYFDLVICQAVLEHVVNPAKCVTEIYRVLKTEGLVYVETPFMQQVHGGAFDFTRYTHSGHRILLRAFQELNSGPTAFAGTSFYWAYYYLLQSLLGFNKQINNFVKLFARFTGFPFLIFDLLTFGNRKYDSASGFFFIGKKSDQTFNPNTDIVSYYNGAN
ncbi:MAG TPA: methyltransferase domain-containing protein [Segetibacter sp.]